MQVQRRHEPHGPDGRPRPQSAAVAQLMSERKVGAAVVMDPDGERARDHHRARHPRLDRRRAGPGRRVVAEHLTRDVVYAAPDWSLEEAAAAMVRGGFRHLIVLEGAETIGILSVRDIVRCWTDDGAICPVPARVAVG